MRRTLVLVGVVVLASSVRAAEPKPVWSVDLDEKKTDWTGVVGLGFAPDGRTLLVQTGTTPADPAANILDSWFIGFDVRERRELFRVAGTVPSPLPPPRFAFVSADRFLTTSGRRLSLLDARTGRTVSSWSRASEPWALWLTADGRRYFLRAYPPAGNANLLVCGALPAPGQKEPGAWKELAPATLLPAQPGLQGRMVVTAAVSPDGTRLAVSDEDPETSAGALTLHRLKTESVVELTSLARTTFPHSDSLSRAQFSPDGKVLATGGSEGALKLWDVVQPANPWKPRATVRGPNWGVSAIAFRSDGKVLVFGTGDPEEPNVWVVDVPLGKPIRSFRAGGPTGKVTSVSIAPDGKTLATGSWRGLVEVWDVEKLLADR